MCARFPGVVVLTNDSVEIRAPINTTYRCMSPTTIRVREDSVTFSDVRLEAYMPGNDLSPAGKSAGGVLVLRFGSFLSSRLNVDLSPSESVCAADQTTTPATPTTAATTTTAAPAPTPPGTPVRGTYSVKNSNGTECLLAQMGLQLNVSYVSQSQNKVTRSETRS